jgi:hypothetical protein
MWKYFVLICWIPLTTLAQNTFEQQRASMPVVILANGVKMTYDEGDVNPLKPSKVVIYALPNGNTTAQTFGKRLAKGDDWHFDIQHIGAQTRFIRNADKRHNYIVIYLENSLKSWPLWRRQVKRADSVINQIVKGAFDKYQKLKPQLVLSGHSGGGSFIFGYINAVPAIPNYVTRLAFLDATYGYKAENHQSKLNEWLKQKNGNSLQVIAYNDSVVIYQGKPLVTPTGGTWYNSKLMAKDIGKLKLREDSDQLVWQNKSSLTSIILLKNPEAKIFHTVMVAKNGFIHSMFNGTALATKNYKFWSDSAYDQFILH